MEIVFYVPVIILKTKRNPTGTLQAAAFDSGGVMFVLGDWLHSEGYVGTTLDIPDFWCDDETPIYFGVGLQDLAPEGLVMSLHDLDGTYAVVSGVIMSRLSGTGPLPSQLASYFMSTSRLSPDGLGGWTGPGFTGTAELIGWHAIEAGVLEASVPSGSGAGLVVSILLVGAAVIVARRRVNPGASSI